jgi:hypothetical protein
LGNEEEEEKYLRMALQNDPELVIQFMQDNNDLFSSNYKNLFNKE